MAVDPREYMPYAESLAATGTEAGRRTSINRDYYACHVYARDKLFGPDAARWRRSPRRPSHREVIDELWRHPEFSEIARNVEYLKKMREVADYVYGDDHPEFLALLAEHGVSGWEGLANHALELARETIAVLDQSRPAE